MSDTDLGLRNVVKTVTNVSKEELTEWFSKSLKGKKRLTITPEALDLINQIINEPDFDGFRFMDTLYTYQDALQGDRVSLEDYVNAIRFCSFLEANGGNVVQAYTRAFSYRDFVKDRVGADTSSDEYKQLSSAAIRYRKNPTVIKILSQAEVPLWLMFQGYRYKAVKRLVEEMDTAKYSRDRINAADKLLLHLKPPENIKVDVNVNNKTDSIVDQYEEMLANMVQEQKRLIAHGSKLTDVANSKMSFIDAKVVNDG